MKKSYIAPFNDWKVTISRTNEDQDNKYHFESSTRKVVEAWVKSHSLPGDVIRLEKRTHAVVRLWRVRNG